MSNPENIPEDLDRDIPKSLPNITGKLRSKEEFITLISHLYKMCTIREVNVNGTVERSIHLKFIGYNANLAAGIQKIPNFANVRANLPGLGRVLQTAITEAKNYRLRHVAESCLAKFDNRDINNELIIACQNAGEETDQQYLYLLFTERFLPLCYEALMFTLKKARLAIQAYFLIEQVKSETAQLKSDYQLMLTSLKNRASVNTKMITVMANKKKAIDDFKSYASYWEAEAFKWVRCILKQLNFHESLSEENLKTWIDQRVIHENIVKADICTPETLPVFKAITDDLDPIINGVRTFTPTPLELAQEKAVLIKSSAARIRKESEDFLKPESEKTIGKAKSLLEQIKSMRCTIDNLQLSGLLISIETVGITQDELEEFYVKISNTLAQKEYEVKLNEAKEKAATNELARGAPQLQLPPLNGFSSWLNFRKAINDIMPLHSNSLIKKQILLKGLKNKEDLLRCQQMDYEDGFKYLVQRYESSALIPGLIDELLKLVPATTDRQTYENLTQLISTTSMLQSYNSIEKLDSNCRSKLIYILINRELQLQFLKDQVLYEESIKKEIPEDRMLDAISEITVLQTAEIEEKRRTWWLEQMGRYLIIVRELIKTKTKSQNQSMSFATESKEVETVESCPVCNDVHIFMGKCMVSLAKCPTFISEDFSVEKRREIVKKFGYCIRCLWKYNNPKCAHCRPISHYLLREKYEDSAESNDDDSQAENNSSSKENDSEREQSGEDED